MFLFSSSSSHELLTMEKIPAACAMEWSIELEKGLRSKRPGEPIKAIEQLGPKLRKWSREPTITLGVSNMYGLVQGEERMFANTILLRLADAFRTGNKEMRASIVKVFLVELRDIMKKGRHYDGILAKRKVPNYLEMLRRVKCVFDTGDVGDRGLSLRLYGCWVDLIKDNADVRYIIISSLRSCHDLEVKASLFAAGSICRLSEDFACIILAMLVDILCSNASCSVKIAAARAFGNMQCSSLIVSRAYKAGKQLLQKFDLDELTTEMIFSLSKLALKSIVLIPEQVEFLVSFLVNQHSSLVNAGVLKCLSLLLQQRCQYFPTNLDIIGKLFHMIGNTDLSVDVHCSVFRLLRKILQSSLQNVPTMVTCEIFKFMSVVLNISKSSVMLKKCLALSILVDISCSLKNSTPQKWYLGRLVSIENEGFPILGLVSDESGSLQFACHVAVLIIDAVDSSVKHLNVDFNVVKLVQEMRSCGTPCKLKHEFRLMFNLLLHLIEEYPKLCPMVLTKLDSLIKELLDLHSACGKGACVNLGEASQEDMDVDKESPCCRFSEADGRHNGSIVLVIISYLCRFISACLNLLVHSSALTSEVLSIVKLFTEHVHRSSFGDYIPFRIFCLNLQSCIMSDLCRIGNQTGQASDELKGAADSSICISQNTHWVHHEYLALEFAKEMLKRRNNWSLYKVGVRSACEGLWLTATFSFRKLVNQVKSDSCSFWLRSLMLMAGAESEIKLLLRPKLSMLLVNWLQSENACGKPCCEFGDVDKTVDGSTHLRDSEGKLAGIYDRIHSSVVMLTSARTSNDFFCFQLWFLGLRANVLETFLDIIKLLSSTIFLEENRHERVLLKERVVQIFSVPEKELKAFVLNIIGISLRLKKLAMEYDLLAISFMDVDPSSSRSISWLALQCSLLAFSTLFPLYFSKSSVVQDILVSGSDLPFLDESPRSGVVQDLAERLWDIDNKSALGLQEFLSAFGSNEDCLQSRTHISSFGHKDKATIMVCRFAISSFHHLHERAVEAKGSESLHQLLKEGMQLLSDIVIKLMDLPLPAPKYFFSSRLCVSSELFIFNAGSKSPRSIFVSPGTQLSLNICIQLRNASLNISSKITKMYCILAARKSDCLSNLEGEKQDISDYQAWKTELMVDLNEKLLLYMNNDSNMTSMKESGASNTNYWVTSFVCLEPNEKGQGFSNCILDVSTFSEGSYPIKWHVCYVNSDGTYWNSLPANSPIFSIKNSSNAV